MKRILALIALLGMTSPAYADTCSKGLTGVFTAAQAVEICGTFSAGVLGTLANNTYAVARNAANSANIDVWKVDTSDNTLINSDASDFIQLQIGGDANRVFNFDASSDTALSLQFGDGGSTATQIMTISAATADGDDDATLQVGFVSGARGAGITLPGEEVAGGGDITYNAGTSDTHIFNIAGTTEATISDDALTFAGASASLAFGATSGIFKLNGNTEATLTDDQLAVAGAAFQIVPGATSFAIRDTADGANNLIITDAGSVQISGAQATANLAVLRGESIDADLSTASSIATTPAFFVADGTGGSNITVVSNGADALSAGVKLIKTRATTTDANTIVQSGDDLGGITAYGADGADYKNAGQILFESDGTPSAGTDMPGRIVFKTVPDSSATLTTAVTIDSSQNVTVAGRLVLSDSGDTLRLQEATAGAACMGTLTANGATPVVTATTCALTGARIFLTRTSAETGVVTAWISAITNATSFEITGEAGDTGTYNWIIFQES